MEAWHDPLLGRQSFRLLYLEGIKNRNVYEFMSFVIEIVKRITGKVGKCWLPALSAFPSVYSKDFPTEGSSTLLINCKLEQSQRVFRLQIKCYLNDHFSL